MLQRSRQLCFHELSESGVMVPVQPPGTFRARLQHRGPYSKVNFSGKIICCYPAHNGFDILVRCVAARGWHDGVVDARAE
ncbi:MAG TPA: hypothetical protein VFE79_13555, partial [Paraburkholderia sp.]|nr:hypothetical protein [Paraburkholderia sp.]